MELEKLEIRAKTTSQARACFEILRDQAADIFAVHTGQPGMPGRGSRTSTSAMTAAVIDSREFLAATERKKTPVVLDHIGTPGDLVNQVVEVDHG